MILSDEGEEEEEEVYLVKMEAHIPHFDKQIAGDIAVDIPAQIAGQKEQEDDQLNCTQGNHHIYLVRSASKHIPRLISANEAVSLEPVVPAGAAEDGDEPALAGVALRLPHASSYPPRGASLLRSMQDQDISAHVQNLTNSRTCK